MGTALRRKMSLDLTLLAAAPKAKVEAFCVEKDDVPALSVLMYEAYRGTIDDEGESLEGARAEIERTFAGVYGAMIWEASFVVRTRESIASAALVTLWQGAPLLAFVMTEPAGQGQGHAGSLISLSAWALKMLGHETLRLVVTRGNAPAEHLYEKLGFLEVESP